MAIVSMVIGLLTIIIGLPARFGRIIPIPMLSLLGAGNVYSLPLSIIGLVLGIIAVRKKPQRSFAIAGIALNAMAILFVIAVIIMWAIIGD